MACKDGDNNSPQKRDIVQESAGQASSPEICLYRYDDFPVQKANMLADVLRKVYPAVTLQAAALALPKEHYNKERNRYRGTGLLEDLRRHRNGNVLLGLTDEVIFMSNELSLTYGIFGLSFTGSGLAIISSTRPSGKAQSEDHLVKLMMHEMGHAFGLKHCSDQHCFMVDAEHGDKFSQTPAFCKSCKSFLNGKGWKL